MLNSGPGGTMVFDPPVIKVSVGDTILFKSTDLSHNSASIAGMMFLLILLFIQFMKINDLKSQRTILRGVFIGWVTVFIVLIAVKLSSIYFILLTGLSSLIILITLFSLIDQIKEEKNTLTDKEIYLLQKLAKKK